MYLKDMSREQLVVWCYDNRPDVYERITASTTKAEILVMMRQR